MFSLELFHLWMSPFINNVVLAAFQTKAPCRRSSFCQRIQPAWRS